MIIDYDKDWLHQIKKEKKGPILLTKEFFSLDAIKITFYAPINFKPDTIDFLFYIEDEPISIKLNILNTRMSRKDTPEPMLYVTGQFNLRRDCKKYINYNDFEKQRDDIFNFLKTTYKFDSDFIEFFPVKFKI